MSLSPLPLFLVTEILIVRRVSYKDRMRRRCPSCWIYARIESGVPMVHAAVIIRLIPDHYAVCPPIANPPPSLSWAYYYKSQSPVPIFQIHSPTTISRPANRRNRNARRYRCYRLSSPSVCWAHLLPNMPAAIPDLLIRLPAIMPSSPANVIPAPSQTFRMTRPRLTSLVPLA